MSNQAQVDALEHLLLAILRTSAVSIPLPVIFEKAQSSILGSDGPGGPQQKSEAVEYLNHLKRQLG